jgi:NADH-quinone oxidoreductase subunit E
LGACVNAPMAQINYDFYEDLTPESLSRILDDLAAGKEVKPGPQIERQLSAPVGGPTTLTDPALYAVNGGGPGRETQTHGGPAVTDDTAKKPGEAASRREEPAPKPPEGDASDGSSTRRE